MSDIAHLIEIITKGDLEEVRKILDANASFVNQKDETGATPLHYAALHGHRQIVWLLVSRGADINSTDDEFGATPAGWAIEYIREMDGFLGIELRDFTYAIKSGDAPWVERWLQRFPALRKITDTNGLSFEELAKESGNPEIIKLFENE